MKNIIHRGIGRFIRTSILVIGALAASVAPVVTPKANAADLPRTYVTTYTATDIGVPGTVAASTTDTANPIIVDVRRHPTIAIAITGRLTSTNPAAATLTIPVHRSVDGTSFEDTAVTSLVLTFTGSQGKVWCTNMNVGDFGYIKFLSYANTGTNGCTNLVVEVSGKPPWALTTPYGQ